MTASQTTKPPGKPQKPDRAQREGRRSRNRERESLCPAGAFPAVASTDKPSTSNSLPPAPRTPPRSPPPPPPYPRPPNLTPPLCHTRQRKKSPPHTNDWEPFSPLRSLLTADGSAPGLFFTSEPRGAHPRIITFSNKNTLTRPRDRARSARCGRQSNLRSAAESSL